MTIEHILKEPCWVSTVKKVVDFGCAELKFESIYLKKLEGIKEIISVDIDKDLLESNSCRLTPSISDFLQRRSSPLNMRVFCGSVANTNEVLVGCDAVIGIELIEHLYPTELEALPFTVFGFIQPRIAMFTTPNADFNVLFPDFSGFRHSDHKFEWSRQDFENWGNNLILRYPDYSVTFQGIGPGPEGTEHLGCCSQMAIFVKQYDSHSVREDELHIQDGNYTLIKEYTYPFDQRTREDKIRDDAISFLNKQISLHRYYNEEESLREIPLKNIMIASKCFSREKLKKILRENNWQIEIDKSGYEVVLIPDSESEDELSSNRSEEYDPEQDTVEVTEYSNIDEDWDNNKEESKDCSTNCDLGCSDCLNDGQITKNTCHDSILFGINQPCSKSEETICTSRANDLNNHKSEIFSEKDSLSNCSVYETPLSELKIKKPASELLSNQISAGNGCFNALIFDTSESLSDMSDEISPSNDEMDETFCCASNITLDSSEYDNNDSFSYVDGTISSLNNSIYGTPCCSKQHNTCIPKTHSLQEIYDGIGEGNYSSILPDLTSEQRTNTSKSMEDINTQDSCGLLENFSNGSKALDSGYTDSFSECNMDLDLTLEQCDEIEAGSESNDDSLSRISPLQIQNVIDNVETNDIINQNRGLEDNSVVANMAGDQLVLEAGVPNLASTYKLQIPESVQCSSKVSKHIEVTNNENSKVASACQNATIRHLHLCCRRPNSPNDICHPCLTSNSVCHLDSLENNSNCCLIENSPKKAICQESFSVDKYSSLTTLIDGCSELSECSLVTPIYQFPDWMIAIDSSLFGKSSYEQKHDNNPSELHFCSLSDKQNLNALSDFESTKSLQSEADNMSLPARLLEVEQLPESGDPENRILEVGHVESFEDLTHPNYGEQFDDRAAGDQSSLN